MKKKDSKGEPGPDLSGQAEPPQAEVCERPEPREAEAAAADLRAERDDLLDRLRRVSADYLNYQKRVRRDISQARAFANEELIKALLGVLDDMERALDAARANHAEDDPLLTGLQLVHDNALATLGKFGLTAIEAEGRPFDPDRHAAVMEQPSDEHPPQTVIKQLQRGYLLKGRTIRPARVVVSKQPADHQPPPERQQDTPPTGADGGR